MNTPRYLSIVRYSAIYDILTTLPLALPVIAPLYISRLASLQTSLGLNGDIPTFSPLHLFFVNLLGAIVMVWSLYRLRHSQSILGLYDAFARFLFAGLMLFYLTVFNIAGIVWLFFIPELSWGVVQLYGYYLSRDSRS